MNEKSTNDTRKMMVLEQYKSLVSDIGNIGTRYATANGFYLSVLTALLGVLAYVGTGKPISDATTTYPTIALVAVFAIVICRIWRMTIEFYGKLFGGKFAVLQHLEKELAVQVYAMEHDEVYTKRHAENLTSHEAKVPYLLAWFFGAIAATVLVLSILAFVSPGPGSEDVTKPAASGRGAKL